jgi:Family of unknown function (DUF6304)
MRCGLGEKYSESSLLGFETEGTYSDSRGTESVVFRVVPREPESAPYPRRYEFRVLVRGVEWIGGDFDCFQTWTPNSQVQELFGSEQHFGFDAGVLTGSLPVRLLKNGLAIEGHIEFRFEQGASPGLQLSLKVDGGSFEVEDYEFESALLRLEKLLPSAVEISACISCLYSDYSPMGQGVSGMQCHRDNKAQYLSVTSKAEYWPVPVSEIVLETHCCPQWVRRIPGTGYRG